MENPKVEACVTVDPSRPVTNDIPPGLPQSHLAQLNVKLTTMTKVQSDYLGLPENGPYKPNHYRCVQTQSLCRCDRRCDGVDAVAMMKTKLIISPFPCFAVVLFCFVLSCSCVCMFVLALIQQDTKSVVVDDPYLSAWG